MYIVITGASRGIGRAIAWEFAKAGHHLAICARNKTDLEQLKKNIQTQYPDCEVIYQAADLSKKEEVLTFAELVNAKCDEIGALINNAGVFLPIPIKEETEDILTYTMAVNVFAPYYLCKGLLPKLRAQRSGYIFNICSVASQRAFAGCGSYTVSKHALLGLSRSLREELKDEGIRVSSVLPGATFTSSWEGTGIDVNRLMPAEAIATIIYQAYCMDARTVLEEIVLRPQLGDL